MFSRYEVYTSVQSIYCYKGTNVLKNKLGIRDAAKLKKAEEEITLIKQMDLMQEPIHGHFTKNHLFSVHRYLFEDVYSFAGHVRREQISKADTMFYPPHLIDRELNKVFAKLKSSRISDISEEKDFFALSAYVMAELNIIHPFREGNGRAIREFIRELALCRNYTLNWGNIPKEDLLKASIESVYDHKVLINVLKQCV